MTGTYRAGSAVADYSLDISAFRRSMAELRTSYRELETLRQSLKPPAFPTTQGTSTTAAQQQGRAFQQSSRAADQAFRSFQQVEREQQRLADSEIRAARATGDYGRALALVDEHLRRASADTVRYNDLVTRRAQIEGQAARGQGGGFGQALGGLQQAAALGGIGLGIQQLTQQGIAAGRDALALDTTERSLRAITGTQQNYNQVLALARENQRLFGGSLDQNVQDLTAFAVTARRTGVDVSRLNDISKRLGILSPEQGAAGASIALNEAFSGNVSSLQRRFEIPAQELDKLKAAAGDTGKQLDILDGILNKAGITSQAVRGAVSDTAQAYNDLAAGAEKARLGIGAQLAHLFERPARGAGVVLGDVGESFNQGSKAEEAARSIALASDSYATYQQRVAAANQQIPFYIQGITALTHQQYEQVRAQEAATRAQQAALEQQRLTTTALGQQLAEEQAGAQGKHQLAQAQQLAADLSTDVTRGWLTQAQAAQQLAASTGISRQEAETYISAQQGLIEANDKTQRGLQYLIRDQQDAALRTQELKTAQDLLARLAPQVNSGLISSANAAQILAAQLRITTGEALALLAAQQRLAAPKGPTAADDPKLDVNRTRQENAAFAAQRGAQARARAEEAAALQRELALTRATSNQKVAIYQREYQAAVARYGANSPEALKAQLALTQAQQQTAKAGTTRLNQQASLNDKLANSEEDLQNRITTIQREALEKQLDAQEQYNRDRQRSNEDYAINAARSAEDEQRKERRLLAEGKILQARQAREEFDRQQRRNAEDQARKNQRAQQDFADARRRDARETAEQLADAQGRT